MASQGKEKQKAKRLRSGENVVAREARCWSLLGRPSGRRRENAKKLKGDVGHPEGGRAATQQERAPKKITPKEVSFLRKKTNQII